MANDPFNDFFLGMLDKLKKGPSKKIKGKETFINKQSIFGKLTNIFKGKNKQPMKINSLASIFGVDVEQIKAQMLKIKKQRTTRLFSLHLIKKELGINVIDIRAIRKRTKADLLNIGLFWIDYVTLKGERNHYLVYSYGRELYKCRTNNHIILQCLKVNYGGLTSVINRSKLAREAGIQYNTKKINQTLSMVIPKTLFRRFVFNTNQIKMVKEIII